MAECGGIVLTSDQQLIIKQEMATQLLSHYSGRFVRIGEVDKSKLAHGHYEVVKADINKPYNVNPKAPAVGDAAPLEGVTADKSMIGKRTKKKG